MPGDDEGSGAALTRPRWGGWLELPRKAGLGYERGVVKRNWGLLASDCAARAAMQREM